MKFILIILTTLGTMFTGYSALAQDSHLIYDGRFDFDWEYYSGSHIMDTARIYRPLNSNWFRNRTTEGAGDIEAGDRLIAINGSSFLRSEKDSSEIYGLREGPASRTFVFEVYRKSVDSVLQLPVTKGTYIVEKFPVKFVDYLVDSSRILTLDDIFRDSVQDRFVTNAEIRDMIYAVPQGNQCTWFRLKIESRLSSDRTYLLVFSGSSTDSISAYYRSPVGEWVTQYAGMEFPEDLRGYVYKDWSAVILNLSNKGIYTVYVRVCTDNLANLRSSYFQSLEYVHESDLKERTIFSFLAGMMTLITILCLLIYFMTRVRSYLLFFLFATSYVILSVARSRYLGELDHTLPYLLTRDFYYLLHIFPVLFFMAFGTHYLEIRARYKRWYKLIITTSGLIVISAALLTVGDLIHDGSGPGDIPSIASVIYKFTGNYLSYMVLAGPAFLRIRRRDSRGWYILLASLFFIILALTLDFIYPGNSVKSLVFGLNTIEPTILLINSVESAGIIVMFLIYALSPYRNDV